MQPDVQARMEAALRFARQAGDLTLRHFRAAGLRAEGKADGSPVTVADRGAEELLRGLIAREFPRDGILGEEFGEQQGESGYRWILDPIDGTQSFVCGVPLYGTLVGVERAGRAVAGVIHMPALRETAWAGQGGGAWYASGEDGFERPTRARASDTTDLRAAVFATTGPAGFRTIGREGVLRRLERTCRVARGWSDCYALLLVATGRIDLCVEPVMHLWDCAGPSAVLSEAGAVYADWSGEETIHATTGLACPRGLLAAAAEVTRGGDEEAE